MKQERDFSEIIDSVQGIISPVVYPVPLVGTPVERAAAYKILKSLVKLTPQTRRVLVDPMRQISGTPPCMIKS